jgi:hypothetical protein
MGLRPGSVKMRSAAFYEKNILNGIGVFELGHKNEE